MLNPHAIPRTDLARGETSTSPGPKPNATVSGLTLERVLPIERQYELLDQLGLADGDARGTRAALSYLAATVLSHLACFAYPPEAANPIGTRLLIPIGPDGYGKAVFAHSCEAGLRFGNLRLLCPEQVSPLAAVAVEALGWTDFNLAPNPARRKQKRGGRAFVADDRARNDFDIYLTCLRAVGAPVPSQEELATKPVCELLATLHADTVRLAPHRLVDLIGNSRTGGDWAEYCQNRAKFPSTAIRWNGGVMLGTPTEDNSAYRDLINTAVAILNAPPKKAKNNQPTTKRIGSWFESFDPSRACIVVWLEDKLSKIVLRRVTDPKNKTGYTYQEVALPEDFEEFFSAPAAPVELSDKEKEEKEAMVCRYIAQLRTKRRTTRKSTMRRLEMVVEYWGLDRTKLAAELAYGHACASNGGSGLSDANPEGSACLEKIGEVKPMSAERRKAMLALADRSLLDFSDRDLVVPEPATPQVVAEAPKDEAASADLPVMLPRRRGRPRKPEDPNQLALFPGVVFSPRPTSVTPPPQAGNQSPELAAAAPPNLIPRRRTRHYKPEDPNQLGLFPGVVFAPRPAQVPPISQLPPHLPAEPRRPVAARPDFEAVSRWMADAAPPERVRSRERAAPVRAQPVALSA